MMNTSFPRTESLISQRVSPTENLLRIRFPAGTPSRLQMLSERVGCELPERMKMFLTMIDVSVGDGVGGVGDGVSVGVRYW